MKTDDQFIQDFNASHYYVNKVANWFQSRGIRARLFSHRLRPDVSKRELYRDDGDIEVTLRVGVKHRTNINFTTIEDYPFPTIFVDSVSSMDSNKSDLYGMTICSQDGKYMIIIPKSTMPQWKKTTVMDKRSNQECTFYEVDKHLCACVKLEG